MVMVAAIEEGDSSDHGALLFLSSSQDLFLRQHYRGGKAPGRAC